MSSQLSADLVRVIRGEVRRAILDGIGPVASEKMMVRKTDDAPATKYGSAFRRAHRRICDGCLHGKHQSCESNGCPCVCNDVDFAVAFEAERQKRLPTGQIGKGAACGAKW